MYTWYFEEKTVYIAHTSDLAMRLKIHTDDIQFIYKCDVYNVC